MVFDPGPSCNNISISIVTGSRGRCTCRSELRAGRSRRCAQTPEFWELLSHDRCALFDSVSLRRVDSASYPHWLCRFCGRLALMATAFAYRGGRNLSRDLGTASAIEDHGGGLTARQPCWRILSITGAWVVAIGRAISVRPSAGHLTASSSP